MASDDGDLFFARLREEVRKVRAVVAATVVLLEVEVVIKRAQVATQNNSMGERKRTRHSVNRIEEAGKVAYVSEWMATSCTI